jgi:hypothetical protein
VLLAEHYKYEDVSSPSCKITVFVFNVATLISKYSRHNTQNIEEFQFFYKVFAILNRLADVIACVTFRYLRRRDDGGKVIFSLPLNIQKMCLLSLLKCSSVLLFSEFTLSLKVPHAS